MGIGDRFKIFIDSLIPPKERSSNPLVYRTVFLKIALLTVLSLIGSIVSFLYFLMDLREGDRAVAFIELLIALILFSTPVVARRYRNIDNIGTVAILTFGLVFIVAVFDELPDDKSSLVWMNVVPALAFMLKGRRGVYWSVLYLLLHIGVVLLAGKITVNALVDAYLSYTLITVIFYFYAWTSESFREVWESIARTDNLTGIMNRVAFEEVLSREVDRAKRYGEPLSLVIFDIDDFKRINDT